MTFGHLGKRLDQKDKVNFKLCDVTTWLTIAIHILTNISRSKDNQAMKFGQLIVHNLRNISVEKSYTKCDGETIPWPFIKKSKLSISLDQYSSFIYFIFIVCQVEDYQKGLKLSCISLAFASNKAFSKIICIIFCMIFEEKYFSCCSFTWPIFNVWLRLLRAILANMCIIILC